MTRPESVGDNIPVHRAAAPVQRIVTQFYGQHFAASLVSPNSSIHLFG